MNEPLFLLPSDDYHPEDLGVGDVVARSYDTIPAKHGKGVRILSHFDKARNSNEKASGKELIPGKQYSITYLQPVEYQSGQNVTAAQGIFGSDEAGPYLIDATVKYENGNQKSNGKIYLLLSRISDIKEM